MLDEQGKKSSFQSTLKRTTYVFCFFFCSYSCLCFYLLVPVPLNLHLSWQSASQSPYIESKCKCIINQAAGNVFALLRITYQSILILLSSFPCVLKCQWAHYIEIQEVISLWWWGLQQPKGSPQVEAVFFSLKCMYGWALMSKTSYLRVSEKQHLAAKGNRFRRCLL